MRRPNKSEKSHADEAGDEARECAKCGHLNPHHRNTCAECGAHLHIVCHQCGHRNPRIASECVQCGKRLHRGWLRRWEKKLFKRNSRLSALQMVLLIVAVYVTYKIITKLANFSFLPPA